MTVYGIQDRLYSGLIFKIASKNAKICKEMITINKLDKSFGPVGTIAGITTLIAGIALIFYSLSGFVLIVLGAFVGLTYTSTSIDYSNRRVKFSNNLFGVIGIGRWVNIESEMKIGIKRSNKTWRTYSRGNRTLDVSSQDFRIILYNSNIKELMPIKKTDSLDSANMQIEKFSTLLGLGVI